MLTGISRSWVSKRSWFSPGSWVGIPLSSCCALFWGLKVMPGENPATGQLWSALPPSPRPSSPPWWKSAAHFPLLFIVSCKHKKPYRRNSQQRNLEKKSLWTTGFIIEGKQWEDETRRHPEISRLEVRLPWLAGTFHSHSSSDLFPACPVLLTQLTHFA